MTNNLWCNRSQIGLKITKISNCLRMKILKVMLSTLLSRQMALIEQAEPTHILRMKIKARVSLQIQELIAHRLDKYQVTSTP